MNMEESGFISDFSNSSAILQPPQITMSDIRSTNNSNENFSATPSLILHSFYRKQGGILGSAKNLTKTNVTQKLKSENLFLAFSFMQPATGIIFL